MTANADTDQIQNYGFAYANYVHVYKRGSP